MEWKRKHLLGLEELEAQEIEHILNTADSFREISTRVIKKVPTLRGRTIVNLFFEPSTRTRTSFELAAKRLSADTLNIAIQASSVVKGETLKDTARNIEAMQIDAIIMRHSMSGAPYFLSRCVKAAVINAGDGCHEHPTQGLLDIFTMREKKGKIKGLKVAIVGDIAHSRVARSNIWGLKKLGAEVTVVGPPTLIPPRIEEIGVAVSYSLDDVLEQADVLNILRIQSERQQRGLFPSIREYSHIFGLTAAKLRKAKKDVLIMHPGPVNLGVEISPEVVDDPRAVILEQVTNGVAIRMAVLYLLLGGAKKG